MDIECPETVVTGYLSCATRQGRTYKARDPGHFPIFTEIL